METLDLSVNNFSGSIPLEIFSNLTQIVKLQLSNNKFTGNLPATVKGITFLKELYIGNNQLSGILPVWLGELSELQSLDLSFNFIAGTISQDHMRNLTRLKHLQLSSNLDIVVNISFSWTPPFQLTSLSLSSCKVGPLFPQWLRNQIEIEDLLISNGSIEDTIPDWFEEVYSTVKFLDLSHNQIKGKWFEKTLESRVVNLDLSHNQLSGSVMSIPYELEQLDLSNNLLSGLMVANDSKLGNWSLISLILKNNQLIGWQQTSTGNRNESSLVSSEVPQTLSSGERNRCLLWPPGLQAMWPISRPELLHTQAEQQCLVDIFLLNLFFFFSKLVGLSLHLPGWFIVFDVSVPDANPFCKGICIKLLEARYRPITFQIGRVSHPYRFMEQQARKRGWPRLLVTADVVERRKSSKRLQNAKRGCIQGEEASQSGCSVDSPNINESPAAGPSNASSCQHLNDASVMGHANAKETSIGTSSRPGMEAQENTDEGMLDIKVLMFGLVPSLFIR
ncbi:hypothetical protein ACET3Z_021856 [Daucus carota]